MHTQILSRAYLRNTPWHALPAAPHGAAAHPAQPLSAADLRRIVAAMID
ncbi:hypothetical protein [Alteraurantiacibacter buctensis]|uniref:Uncharacterized protein n=1 Tax=Alteraurantiacibacter buctensis TaxID=1503981 RepID=A0A844YTJ1_9SPHN|nr:hypothetical protein [Alteraurantiacibacter buctensis]MXO70158.1 hypothetical protein [Alteraurantiacibacter buctensis]